MHFADIQGRTGSIINIILNSFGTGLVGWIGEPTAVIEGVRGKVDKEAACRDW